MHRSDRPDAIGQRLAVDQFHDDRWCAAHVLNPVARGDVGMIGGRQESCLATRAPGARRSRVEERGNGATRVRWG